jgi:hypothetical protein
VEDARGSACGDAGHVRRPALESLERGQRKPGRCGAALE